MCTHIVYTVALKQLHRIAQIYILYIQYIHGPQGSLRIAKGHRLKEFRVSGLSRAERSDTRLEGLRWGLGLMV